MKHILIMALLIVSLGISASAQIITNGSFEQIMTFEIEPCTQDQQLFTPEYSAILGWSVGQGAITQWCNIIPASQGIATVQLTASSSLYQDVPTVPGVVYQVTFDMSGFLLPVKTMTVTADGGSAAAYEYTDPGNGFTNMNWAPRVYSFTANDNLTRLMFTSTTDSNFGPFIDNVTASARAGMVCHTNNGSGQPRTMNLTEGWAFWAHTQHGDQMGACP